MMRRPPLDESLISQLDALLAPDDGASLEERAQLLQLLRRTARDGAIHIDLFLLERLHRLGQGFAELTKTHAELAEVIERLRATPWHPAVFLRALETAVGLQALVVCAGARRLIEVAGDVDLAALLPGEEVLLAQDMNVVVARWPDGVPQAGDTAFFERRIGGDRLVLKWRDEEVVVEVAATLNGVELAPGDQLLWDRVAGIAFEKLDRPAERRFLLDEVPEIGREQIGGQEENLELLLSVLTSVLVDPAKATCYGLGGRQTAILVGPNGVGKTLLVRIAASEVTRLSGRRCRFAVVKPAEWESPWVGETQRNIRECFKGLREAAADGCAILFLDEIEAVGRTRGSVVGHHSDKFLAAFLAELDGFEGRGNVAIVAATNRKDLLDPALLERLSDTEIHVRRPDRRGARAIFRIHLPESLPFATGVTRDEIVDAAAARFYSPNASNELAVLRFRDGKARTILAHELGSGRTYEQICRAARRAAFLRDVRGGERGLTLADVEDAVAQAFERLASMLTPHNARAYLSDLPQDIDVVSAEPIVRRVGRPHRYLNAA